VRRSQNVTPAEWWAKKENIEKFIQAHFDYRTRVFQSTKKYSGGLSPSKFLVLSKLAAINGLQFLIDSLVLFQRESYGHSVALAIFALEELGKSTYCNLGHKGWIDMRDFHRYMRRHRLKFEVLKSLEGISIMRMETDRAEKTGKPISSDELTSGHTFQSNQKWWDDLEKLRSNALYVDYERPTAFLTVDKEAAEDVLSVAVRVGIAVGQSLGLLSSDFQVTPKSARLPKRRRKAVLGKP